MLPPVGCAAALALIAFVIGLVAASFVPDQDWTARLIMAAVPAFCTFLASLLLMVRDAMRHAAAMRAGRNYLQTSIPTTADEFLAARPCEDPERLLDTRQAVARYFDVPAEQVHRSVHLQKHLHIDQLAPEFYLAVTQAVLVERENRDESFAYRMIELNSIDELAEAIKAAANDSAGPTRRS